VQGFLDSLLGAEAGAQRSRDSNVGLSNVGLPNAPPTPAERLEAAGTVREVRAQGTIEAAQAVAQAAEANLSAGATEVVREEAAQVMLSLLRTDSPDVQQAVRDAVQFLEPRPRNYKRFLNAFRLHVIIASRAEHQPDAAPASLARIAKWTALQLRWPVILEEARTRDDLFAELEPLVHDYRAAEMALREAEDLIEAGDATTDDLTKAAEVFKRAHDAFPPRIRATAEFEALVAVLAAEPSLAGTDLHGLVLV
jgi:hypothetical protein